MIKAGLILEGGAARGVFTAGVLDYLMEHEIYFSHVVGVSAGCCNGVDYLSRQIGRSRDCMIHRDKKARYTGAHVVLKKHCLFDMDKIFNEYPYRQFPFDFETYQVSEMQAEWVVTNCLTGKAEYLDDRSDGRRLMEICRASSSIPVLSKMVEIDGTPYLDGGIADSVPLKRLLSYGNEKNIIVLTRNPGYRKKPFSKAAKRFYDRVLRDYPELVQALKTRYLVYNRTMEAVERLREQGRVFVIQPTEKTVGRAESDYDRLMSFYQHGYHQMAEQMEALRSYLES